MENQDLSPLLLNEEVDRGSAGHVDMDSSSTNLVYDSITYVLPVKVKRKKELKTILDNCSGIMSVGLNAILGPTGSGKTSLLDVLAGRKQKKFLSGNVLVNGQYQTKSFRLSSGFVVQDDIIMGTLTVRENIHFSANLRLPSSHSKKSRENRVEMIIEDLGLQNCADTMVGTDETRGVSGGERKRTNIGMELIIQPDILFLDEPTTGLDSTTASSVMKLLKRQAEKGRTIIFSIHQPRYSIFKLFDRLTLLSAGETIYHGVANDALPYFENLGYQCETHDNPADFFLDLLSNDVIQKDGGKSRLCKLYENSNTYTEITASNQSTLNTLTETNNEVEVVKTPSYQASFIKQMGIVCQRALLNLVRNPRGFILQVFVSIVFSAMVGGIYYQLKCNEAGIQNRTGVMFFLIMNMIFSNLSAIVVFINEREIFRHESANGYYRVSSYFIAKLFCDILPMRIIPLVVFAVIAYFMIGLRSTAIHFLIFLLVLGLTSIAASSLCLFISSSVNLYEVANLCVALMYVLMMLFGGFLVRLSDIPSPLRWLRYLSIFKYGLTALEINELRGLTFGSKCDPFLNQTCPSGDEFLLHQGIKPSDLWVDVAVLAGFILFFLTLTYMQLRKMKKFR